MRRKRRRRAPVLVEKKVISRQLGVAKLKKLAKEEAAAIGHSLGRFYKTSNKDNATMLTFRARCNHCEAMAVLIPELSPFDSVGRGGSALRIKCTRA